MKLNPMQLWKMKYGNQNVALAFRLANGGEQVHHDQKETEVLKAKQLMIALDAGFGAIVQH
ncbi:hypothetical protein H5410_029744 [Solanum commersonii]|uniref:Uncharacterized protein n=1 Tax=Solanum commersonii TaxID=4109 RepID=A0A9J5YH94_SOLCO|nr:hypothetical protein H5410_029744 [Solanum commersonii]